ncbi:MAG TPA: kelch repeat-containing protein [Stellaceae bacterium]|nr:kelch repeat-containing protein [Stellaceae bacterium]
MAVVARVTGFCLLASAIAAGGLTPLRAADPPGTWSTKAPMSAPREDEGVVAFDGKLYAIGGTLHQDAQIRRNEVYDPASDSWRTLAPMPRGTHHLAVAELGGQIYAFGGFTAPAHGAPVDVAFAYDVKADSWRTLPSLSSPRGSPSAVALGGKLHVVGGRGLDGRTIATHEAFDPATGQWSTLAPVPQARDHIALIVVDGKMHAIGGRLASTDSNQTLHDVYDPATNSWSTAAPMPTPRSSTGITLYHGMIVVVGGEGDATGPGSAFKDNEGYDLKTGQWVKLLPLPLGKHAFGAATIGDIAYFPGGSSTRGGEGVTAEMMVFTLP